MGVSRWNSKSSRNLPSLLQITKNNPPEKSKKYDRNKLTHHTRKTSRKIGRYQKYLTKRLRKNSFKKKEVTSLNVGFSPNSYFLIPSRSFESDNKFFFFFLVSVQFNCFSFFFHSFSSPWSLTFLQTCTLLIFIHSTVASFRKLWWKIWRARIRSDPSISSFSLEIFFRECAKFSSFFSLEMKRFSTRVWRIKNALDRNVQDLLKMLWWLLKPRWRKKLANKRVTRILQSKNSEGKFYENPSKHKWIDEAYWPILLSLQLENIKIIH